MIHMSYKNVLLWRKRVVAVLPELSAGCFSLEVSMPAPIKFMIFSI